MSSPQSKGSSHYVVTGEELLTEKFHDLTLVFILVSKEIINCSLSVTTLYVRYNLILTWMTCSVIEQNTLLCGFFQQKLKKYPITIPVPSDLAFTHSSH